MNYVNNCLSYKVISKTMCLSLVCADDCKNVGDVVSTSSVWHNVAIMYNLEALSVHVYLDGKTTMQVQLIGKLQASTTYEICIHLCIVNNKIVFYYYYY